MTRTRAEIGRSNVNRGKEAEQDVARWLRNHGWPSAKRTVRTGWRVGDRQSPDRGDIDGTDRLSWQVKIPQESFTDRAVLGVLAQANAQAVAARADYAIVVQRRAGKSDPGRWWAWLTVNDLAYLSSGHYVVGGRRLDVPVRMLLGDLVPLLHAAGYGGAQDVAGDDETNWDTRQRHTAGADQDTAAEEAAAAEGRS